MTLYFKSDDIDALIFHKTVLEIYHVIVIPLRLRHETGMQV